MLIYILGAVLLAIVGTTTYARSHLLSLIQRVEEGSGTMTDNRLIGALRKIVAINTLAFISLAIALIVAMQPVNETSKEKVLLIDIISANVITQDGVSLNIILNLRVDRELTLDEIALTKAIMHERMSNADACGDSINGLITEIAQRVEPIEIVRDVIVNGALDCEDVDLSPNPKDTDSHEL